jgi:hypothetical protein
MDTRPLEFALAGVLVMAGVSFVVLALVWYVGAL